MPHDDRAEDDIAALIEADLKASGARTPQELREVLAVSVMSLLHWPEPIVEIDEVDGGGVRVSIALSAPRWPGKGSNAR